MRGAYDIVVKNRRLQYKFTIERNITILRGDSATGKTTLIEMIAAYQRSGEQSGVTVLSERPCVVLPALNWQLILSGIHDSIVFIDEGDSFVASADFARQIQGTSNYYVIATRASLFNLPYSVKEIYGIKNKAGNRYQGTKRLYAEFFPLCTSEPKQISRPDLVVVEDAHSGYAFFFHVFSEMGIRCISAAGKSNIYRVLRDESYTTALVIADGAAFGPEIERILLLKKAKPIVVYLPESFEWLVLRSGLIEGHEVQDILADPAPHIESETYISWERYFTALLIEQSSNTYLSYQKNVLNPNYYHTRETQAIMKNVPEIAEP